MSTLRTLGVLVVAVGVVAVVLLMRQREADPDETGLPTPSGTPRVVALSPALALGMHRLGIEESIVGCHNFDTLTDESVPRCGDQITIDFEMLLRAKPTHVLMEWGSRELPARLIELGRRNGWQIEQFAMTSLEDLRESTRRLGALFDRPTGALLEEMDAALEPRELRSAGDVLLLMHTDPPTVLGPGSHHHEALVRIGATPAISDGDAWIELDSEDVLRLAPDVIVLVIQPFNSQAGVAPDEISILLGPLARLDIPAVRRGHVIVIDDPLALLPSLSVIEFARGLGDRLETIAAKTLESGANPR